MPPYPQALADWPRLRQSTLADFDNCPQTWRFSQQHDQGFSTAPAARGTLWHRFAAKLFTVLAEERESRIEVDIALAVLHETLRQADVPLDEVVPCPMHEVADLYWMVKKLAFETSWNINNLYSIEERLESKLYYPDPDGGDVERTLSGQLDLLFVEGANLEHGIVLDWKTGWWLPPPSEISEEGFFQQRTYALLAFDNHPSLTSVTTREYYPRYCEPREATIYRSQVEDLRIELGALVEQFDRSWEAQQWKPMPGKHCGHCVRPTGCPIFPKARRDGAIRTADEAEYVAAQVLVAEAAIKQNKAALKVWSAEHGSIPVRDAKSPRVYGFQTSSRTSRPTQEQAQRAIEQGVSIDDLYKKETVSRFAVHIPKPLLEPEDDDLLAQLEESVRQAEARK